MFISKLITNKCTFYTTLFYQNDLRLWMSEYVKINKHISAEWLFFSSNPVNYIREAKNWKTTWKGHRAYRGDGAESRMDCVQGRTSSSNKSDKAVDKQLPEILPATRLRFSREQLRSLNYHLSQKISRDESQAESGNSFLQSTFI